MPSENAQRWPEPPEHSSVQPDLSFSFSPYRPALHRLATFINHKLIIMAIIMTGRQHQNKSAALRLHQSTRLFQTNLLVCFSAFQKFLNFEWPGC